MIRVTTSSVMRNYKSNLMRSYQSLYKAQEKVETQRNFNSYAEDPTSATQAFRLRRIFSRTSDQLSNISDTLNKYDSAWTTMSSVKQLVEKSANEISLTVINDPESGGRLPLGQALDGYADSIVQLLNTKYGDSYIFAGCDGMNVPFSWDQNTGGLLYRGISVDTTDPDELAQLKKMTEGTILVDVGAGLAEQGDGSINSATVFNASICGLDYLGYGVDADGDPVNAVSLMKKMADLLATCDKTDGSFPNPKEDMETAQRLTSKLQDAIGNVIGPWTELLDTKADYLQTVETRLEDYGNSVNEQIIGLEQCDLADAMLDYEWAKYCYTAALQCGDTVISQTLFDYMN